ncbi:signal peptidase I [Candidatus Marinamargulisbacteria bacterium SCGC AG-414-C22]|nr:signal peptidase I [Candidatus Marinamargulisbacteria bacterium SCGC AG-414-C22]
MYQQKISQWDVYKKDLKLISKWKYVVVETVETLLFALFFALLITRFVIQVSVVPTGSMIPTMLGGVPNHPNERLLVNKFIYRFVSPKRGDIVVFKSPHQDGKDYVKRCVGLPGETIALRNGKVFVNDKELVLVGVDVQFDGSYFDVVTIPDDHYFMLGDNRGSSQDSRYWGFVPQRDLVGKALFTIWPLNRMRWLL